MKNWGKFFMMVAVLLSLVACGSKGGGSGGGGSVNVPKNDKMYNLIQINRNEINYLQDSYPEELYLQEIRNILREISIFYSTGGLKATLDEKDLKLKISVENYFRYGVGRNWLNLDEIKELYLATIDFQTNNSKTSEEKEIARKIGGKINNEIIEKINRKILQQKSESGQDRSHYVELWDIWLNENMILEKPIKDVFPGEFLLKDEKVRTFLVNHDLIFNGDRESIYNIRIKILKNERNIINLGSNSGVISKDILDQNNINDLNKVINELINQYELYNLSISFTNFDGFDNNIYEQIINRPGDITQGILKLSDYSGNQDKLAVDLKKIIDKLEESRDKLGSTEYLMVNSVILKLKDPYYRINAYGDSNTSNKKSIVFSKSIVLAEIIQIISDNITTIKTYGK